MTPAAMAEDWADWSDLAGAFVAAYAPEGIEELEQVAPLTRVEVGEDTVLSAADRAHHAAVELLLDAYPEMRLGDNALGGGRLVRCVGRSASERCR